MSKIRLLFFLGVLAFAMLSSSAYGFQITTTRANYDTPVLENKTTAVSTEMPQKGNYHKYSFQVTNNSAKNIVTIRVTAFFRKKSATYVLNNDRFRPILPSGKTMEITPPLPFFDEKLPLEIFSDPSDYPKIVINGLVFDDLTNEGDQLGSVQIAGQWLGYKIQAQKVINILQEILKNIEQDQDKFIENFRQHIAGLAEKAVESDTKHLEQRLAPLTKTLAEELKSQTSLGLASLKQDIFISIALYKGTAPAQRIEPKTLLTHMLEYYEEQVGILSKVF